MKLLISFFIFLISFFAPTQAINAAIPVQVGSYSNPIEPIKPKAKTKTYKWGKKPITTKTQETSLAVIVITILALLLLIAGFVLFSMGYMQGVALLFWLGLGFELSCLGWLLGLLIFAMALDNLDAILPYIISFFGIPIAFALKGLVLIGLGLSAATPIWILGLSMFVIGIVLVSLLWYMLETL